MIQTFLKDEQGMSFHNRLILKIGDVIQQDEKLWKENQRYVQEWFEDFDGGLQEESESFNRFMNSFIYEREMRGGKKLLHYLTAEAKQYFSKDELVHIGKISDHFYSVFDIVDFKEGEYLYLRDLIADKVYKTQERSASMNPEIGTVLFARMSVYDGVAILLYNDGAYAPPHSYRIKRSFVHGKPPKEEALNSWFFEMTMVRRDAHREESGEPDENVAKQVKKIFTKIHGKKFKFGQMEKALQTVDLAKEIDPQIKPYTDEIRKHFSEPEAQKALETFYRYLIFLSEQKADLAETQKGRSAGPMEQMLIEDFMTACHAQILRSGKEDMNASQMSEFTRNLQKKWLNEGQKELLGKTPQQMILEERKSLGNPDGEIDFEVIIQKLGGNPKLDEIKSEALALMNERKFSQAMPLFQKLISEIKDNYIDTFNLAACHFYLGDRQMAAQLAKKSLEIYPDYEKALDFLEHLEDPLFTPAKLEEMEKSFNALMERMDRLDPKPMSTEDIIKKLTKMCPSFTVEEFKRMALGQITAEALADVYYKRGVAKVHEDERDFVWMACAELWKRLCPDLLSVDGLEDELDALMKDKGEKDITEVETDALIELAKKYEPLLLDSSGKIKEEVQKILEGRYWDVESVFSDIPMHLLNQRRHKLAEKWGLYFYRAFGQSMPLLDAAEARFEMGNKKEAEELFRQAFEKDSDPYGLLNLSSCHQRAGDLDKARKVIAELRKAVDEGKIKLDDEDLDELEDREEELG